MISCWNGPASTNPPSVARYDKAAKARDDAQDQLEKQHTVIATLGSRVKELESHELALTVDLESAQKKALKFEKDAAEADKLLEQVNSLKKTNESNKLRLEELSAAADTPDGQKALDREQSLVQTRYAAYIGWGCSVLLGLALAASHFHQKPPEEPVADDTERPPHVIV